MPSSTKERQEMNRFKKSEIIVFDMDGTLYKLDGESGTFKNSKLFKKVISNSVSFVMNFEKCDKKTAQKVVKQGLSDSIGISNLLSKRYNISRANYFDIVWNINPKDVILNSEVPTFVVKTLVENEKRLFLLTSAPRIWMENVINELNLADLFERKYCGEMFSSKNEIFYKLSGEFDPKKIISVGDQLETDLKPAQQLGMKTFLVSRPEELIKLI